MDAKIVLHCSIARTKFALIFNVSSIQIVNPGSDAKWESA
jgi:hypothetical protein